MRIGNYFYILWEIHDKLAKYHLKNKNYFWDILNFCLCFEKPSNIQNTISICTKEDKKIITPYFALTSGIRFYLEKSSKIFSCNKMNFTAK